MKGRKPKPTNLRVLEGNPGKRKLNDAEPRPPEGPIARPAWVKRKAAIEAWDALAPVLSDMQVLTTADVFTLAVLCEAFADWRKTRTAAHLSRLHALLSEFGLAPSSRSRIRIPKGSKTGPLSEFLA